MDGDVQGGGDLVCQVMEGQRGGQADGRLGAATGGFDPVPVRGCRVGGQVDSACDPLQLPVMSCAVQGEIERFLGTIASTRSVGTAARVRTTLRGLFYYAVRSRVIRDSPAAVVRLPRPDSGRSRPEFRPFTMEELQSVVE